MSTQFTGAQIAHGIENAKKRLVDIEEAISMLEDGRSPVAASLLKEEAAKVKIELQRLQDRRYYELQTAAPPTMPAPATRGPYNE